MRAICVLILPALVWSGTSWGEELLADHLNGDVGAFYDAENRSITGESTRIYFLPYAYFDYGRIFARIDTFGIKTVPMGYGHMEIAGRVSLDGINTSQNPALKGINDRQNSLPVGLGSFQLTPVGGFFIYALHDIGKSRGNIFELTYAAETALGNVEVYPEAGIEYCSSRYTQYFYGISRAESAASGLSYYSPGSALNLSLGAFVDVPVVDQWHAIFYLHRKWLDSVIYGSPLIDRKYQDSGFVAITLHFK